MSCGDGLSVLAFLKSTPNSAIVPTVVLSASGDLDDIKKAYMLGASAYFIKPHQNDALQRIIKVLVDFWMLCEVPEVDEAGTRRLTETTMVFAILVETTSPSFSFFLCLISSAIA